MSDLEHRILTHCCKAAFRAMRKIDPIHQACLPGGQRHEVVHAVWCMVDQGILNACSTGGTMTTFEVTLVGNEVARQAGIIKTEALA